MSIKYAIKHGILIVLMTVLALSVLASCGGPAEKRAGFYNRGKQLYAKGDYVKAKLEFENAVQIDPKYADAYYMLGMVALKTGDFSGAHGMFSQAVELSPGNSEAQVQLGKFLLGEGKTDEAMGKAELVLKKDPKNEDALILKGAVLMKEKDVRGARSFLESVVGRKLRKPQGYLLLAAVDALAGDADNAMETLREGIKHNLKAVPLYIALADLELRKKQADEAAGLMQKVIGMEPDVPRYRLALAAIYWSSGKEKEATGVLNAFVSAKPGDEERWIQAADFYNLRKRPDLAEQQLKEGIRRNAKGFKVRFALGAFYLATNRTDQAISVMKECTGLDRDPANPNVLHAKNSLAEIYLSRRDIDTAKKYVDEVMQESPKDMDANYIEGNIYLDKKQSAQAVASFRLVVNGRPQFIPGYIGLADAQAIDNDPKLAFATLQDALKIEPRSKDVNLAMARLFMARTDLKDAEAQYRAIVHAHPKDLQVRAELGDLMMEKGDFGSAERQYAEIRKMAPGDPFGYFKMSAFYIARRNWAMAIAELEKVLRINPNLWGPMNDLAFLLCDHGRGGRDLDKALALARRAGSISRGNPLIFDTLGWIQYRRGDMGHAIGWLGKALAKNSGDPVVNYHLGMAYYRAGNPGKARGYLQNALSSRFNFSWKGEAKKILAGIRS